MLFVGPLARRHRVRERGAVAIVLALVLAGILLPVSALVVDLGQQRVVRKDVQALADTAALDAARSVTPTSTDATVTAAAQASAGQDSGVAGDSPTVVAKLGYIDPAATWISDQTLGCDDATFTNGYFTYPAPAGKANAVLVIAHGSARFSFAGVLGASRGGACRSAIGTTFLSACMMMDSYAANVTTSNATALGPLFKILGTNLDTTALSSSGILTTDLSLLDFLNVLKTQLSVGTADQVLGTQVSAAQVVAAEVAALNNKGGTASAAASFLSSQVGAYITSTTKMTVGDLLGVSQGDASALSAAVNPLDLAAAAVQVANGSHPLQLDLSSTNLSGIDASVTVGSRPTRVCLGQGIKTMDQTSVKVSANISGGMTGAATDFANALSGLLSGVLNGLGSALGADSYSIPKITFPDPISASLGLAQAGGKVDALNCSGATPQSMAISEQSSLLPLTVTVPLVVTVKHTYGLLGSQSENLSTKLVLSLTTVPTSPQSTSGTLALPGDYGKAVAGPSGNLSIDNLQVGLAIVGDDAKDTHGNYLVGDLLGGVSALTTAVNLYVLTPLETYVVTPLLTSVTSALGSLLGATIAGSTYTPLQTPSCGTPQLKN